MNAEHSLHTSNNIHIYNGFKANALNHKAFLELNLENDYDG